MRSVSRAESGMPATSPASGGVTSTEEAEYHQTVASTRRSTGRPRGARASSTRAVQSGSARWVAGRSAAPGGATRPNAAEPGSRATTARCTASSATSRSLPLRGPAPATDR